MKAFKKIIALTLACLCIGGLFVGCNHQESVSNQLASDSSSLEINNKNTSTGRDYPAKNYFISHGGKINNDGSSNWSEFDSYYEKTADGKIQMVQDQKFLTGFNALGFHPSYTGRTVRNIFNYGGAASSNANIDPWELSQWYTIGEADQDKYIYDSIGDNEFYRGVYGEKYVRANRHKGELQLFIDTNKTTVANDSNQWPHLLVEKTFSYMPTFGEMDSMVASMKFMVSDYVANTGINCAQLGWWFYVSNVDSSGNGVGCFFGFPLFDSRNDIHGNTSANPMEGSVGWEHQVLVGHTSMSRKSFAPDIHASKVKLGTTYSVSFDLKAYFKTAVSQLASKYPEDFSNVSIDDFYITGFNIGWEIPQSQLQVSLTVSDISILLDPK